MRRKNKAAPKSYNLEFEGILVRVDNRRVKYPRIEYRPSGLILIVPRNVNPLNVLNDYKSSILKKYGKLRARVESARKVDLVDRGVAEFNGLVHRYLELYARELKVSYSEVKFRKMRRRWGSCRSNGVITLNKYLVFLPEKLVAYIIFHELAHLRVPRHDRAFKDIIAAKFPDYRALDKDLDLYGLRLLP